MKRTTIAIFAAIVSIAFTACKSEKSTEQNTEEQNTEIVNNAEEANLEDEIDLDTPEGRIQNFKQQAEELLKSYLETEDLEEADAMQENFETVLPVLAESLTDEDLEQLKPWTDEFKARADKEMKAHHDKLANQ